MGKTELTRLWKKCTSKRPTRRTTKKEKNTNGSGKNKDSDSKKEKNSKKVIRKVSREKMLPKEPQEEEEGKGEECRAMPSYMTNVTPERKAAYEQFARQIFSQGVDGLLKEYLEQLKGYVGQPAARQAFDQHPGKNRYKDVVCNDYTRVVLADGRQPDYIHANYVMGEPLLNEFICTQGPMAGTKIEFWRMIFHLNIRHVVMLCETVECGKPKCEQYWPLNRGETMQFGDMTVEHMSQNCKDPLVTSMKLTITYKNEKKTLRHHHWKTWPDRSIPRSSKAVLRILRTVRYSPTPIVVHCSAGIGRTGTLVAIEMCIQTLLKTGQLNLIAVCKRLRDQRHGVLQVDTQFVYLALAVLEFGSALGYFGDVAELVEDLQHFKSNLEAVVVKREEAMAVAAAAAATNGMEKTPQDKKADAGPSPPPPPAAAPPPPPPPVALSPTPPAPPPPPAAVPTPDGPTPTMILLPPLLPPTGPAAARTRPSNIHKAAAAATTPPPPPRHLAAAGPNSAPVRAVMQAPTPTPLHSPGPSPMQSPAHTPLAGPRASLDGGHVAKPPPPVPHPLPAQQIPKVVPMTMPDPKTAPPAQLALPSKEPLQQVHQQHKVAPAPPPAHPGAMMPPTCPGVPVGMSREPQVK